MKTNLKAISYNIHAGIGMDGILDLDRISDIIAEEDADIVGLNEVDKCTSRTEQVDQAEYIADKLGYHYVFGKAIDYGEGEYGNAFMSRYPIISCTNHRLPIHSSKTREPRAMLECKIEVDGKIITVLTTHLGLEKAERKLSIDYISHIINKIDGYIVLIGDFNIKYNGEFVVVSPFLNKLKDTAEDLGKADNIMTFNSENPERKIDYIMVSKDIKVISTYIVSSIASDHLPLICEFNL